MPILQLPTIPSFREPERNRRVLFVTYGASHVAKVAPVVRELERQGVECLVIALTIGFQKAQQLGLKPLGYRDFLGLVDDPARVMARGQALVDGNSHPEVDPVESSCYLGINFQEWVDELGESGALTRYVQKGRQGFMPVTFMGRVIDALEPGVVVATSTPRSEEAAIRAARHRGIPCLTMVDLFAPPSDPFVRRPVHADRITVVSEEVRERFIREGLDAAQVAVTGSPDFDELFEPAASLAGAAFRSRMGWSGCMVVMWAGILEKTHREAPSEYEGSGLGLLVEKELRQWVAARRDAALVVRYHPGQYHEFPKLPPQERVHVSDPAHEGINPLLHASDAVIHQISTVGFQAALLKKRVLNLEFSAWARDLDFDLSSLGPNEGVPSLQALVPLLESPPGGAGGGRKMSVPEGPSAPRVANHIIGLLNDTRNA